MNIKQLKKELGLTNKDIAKFFGLKPINYATSTAKPRYEAAMCSFYAFAKKQSAKGENIETTSSQGVDLEND